MSNRTSKQNIMEANGEGGYTLVALLAAMVVAGILMAGIAPTWRHLVIRDREEELVFRGEQYVQAISLFQERFNSLPTDLEELVELRLLRRLYDDPITRGPFELIYSTPAGPRRASALSQRRQADLEWEGPGRAALPIIGVVSRSKDEAIRPYKENRYYNEWTFIHGAQEEVRDDDEGEQEGRGRRRRK